METVGITVTPTLYQTKTPLRLPLRGKLMVYDGHDYLAHHRRVDLSHPGLAMLDIHSNFVRYAIDFCVLDEQDRLTLDDGKNEKKWFGYSQKVFAPADGKIVYAQNDVLENVMGQPSPYANDPKADAHPELSMGNCVIIDHGNGEFSWLVHMLHGSLLVIIGDNVHQGQEIGKIGFSGDTADFVHLHYSLTDSFNLHTVEGLPPTFHNFK